MSDELIPLLVIMWVVVIFMGTGGGIGATHSEVNATAEVVGVEYHDSAVEATINVTNTDSEEGSIGLHVHYWSDECNKENGNLLHSHKPSTFTDAGETVTIQDTYSSGDFDEVDCVSAHIHE